MPKLRLQLVECPKCEGEGGFDMDGPDGEYYMPGSGFLECNLCNGTGEAIEATPIKEEKNGIEPRDTNPSHK